jgi:uncharacterized membrane protein YcaP (DUF421 family)
MFDAVDWQSVLTPKTPLLELLARGTAVYLCLFVLLRLTKRQTGSLSVSDLLVLVLIADAAQNAMAGEYKSLPDGLFLVSVIVFWSFALDWLGYRVPAVGRFLHPPAVELVRNGRMLRQNMRREMITVEELMSQLREQGIDALNKIKSARLEGDGQISVITRQAEQHPTPKKKQT